MNKIFYEQHKAGVKDKNGQILIPAEYFQIKYEPSVNLYIATIEAYSPASKLFNYNGEEVLPESLEFYTWLDKFIVRKIAYEIGYKYKIYDATLQEIETDVSYDEVFLTLEFGLVKIDGHWKLIHSI